MIKGDGWTGLEVVFGVRELNLYSDPSDEKVSGYWLPDEMCNKGESEREDGRLTVQKYRQFKHIYRQPETHRQPETRRQPDIQTT